MTAEEKTLLADLFHGRRTFADVTAEAVALEREACAKELELGAFMTSITAWKEALTAGAAAIRRRCGNSTV